MSYTLFKTLSIVYIDFIYSVHRLIKLILPVILPKRRKTLPILPTSFPISDKGNKFLPQLILPWQERGQMILQGNADLSKCLCDRNIKAYSSNTNSENARSKIQEPDATACCKRGSLIGRLYLKSRIASTWYSLEYSGEKKPMESTVPARTP